ncbi:MAG: acyltransferase [Candidatus Thorarchaeota archaeon]|jgi:carbonic anhydrase/acetyltransferase-like protein (isoleucine patch superfamily)
MKLKTIAYGIYMALSILVSITVAIVPAIASVLVAYEHLDRIVTSFGGIFTAYEQWVYDVFGWFLPQIVFDKFWFILAFPTLMFVCYGLFLAILAIMFRLSQKVIPKLEDGFYALETDKWLLYEYREVYYLLFPYFAWFFTVFFDVKARHIWFGAKLGSGTIVGNGRLLTPDRIIVGKNSLVGFGSILTGHMYEGEGIYLKTVKIGNNVTIGGYAIVFPGAEVGDNVIIAANSVVPKDRKIPANTIWVRGKAVPRRVTKEEIKDEPVLGGPVSLHKEELVGKVNDLKNSKKEHEHVHEHENGTKHSHEHEHENENEE